MFSDLRCTNWLMLLESSKVNWIKKVNHLLKNLSTHWDKEFILEYTVHSFCESTRSVVNTTHSKSVRRRKWNIQSSIYGDWRWIYIRLFDWSKLHTFFDDQRWPDVVNGRPIFSVIIGLIVYNWYDMNHPKLTISLNTFSQKQGPSIFSISVVNLVFGMQDRKNKNVSVLLWELMASDQ